MNDGSNHTEIEFLEAAEIENNRKIIHHLAIMQNNINHFIEKVNGRLKDLEQQDNQQKAAYEEKITDLRDQIKRMEAGILLDFKTTQDILKARLEHEMAIEKAKLEFEQKLQAQQEENKEKQEAMIREGKQQRQKIRNELLFKIGGIVVPVLVAASAFLIKWLEGL